MRGERRGRRALSALLLIGIAVAVLALNAGSGTNTARAATGCPWMNPKLSPNKRASELLGAMSLDQKLAMLTQAEPDGFHYGAAGYVPAQPSLCIPALVLNDAGQGVGDQQTNTTAFPAGIAQSSSWNPSLQFQFGQALGWEAFHKGINVQLAPGVEIDRVPLNGRNFEYMSEDPFLAGQGGAAVIRGIQSEHVIATVKHYVANSQETNRMTDSSNLSERTLQEIYLPAYQAAVRAGVGSVMCSYNRINGVYSCEDPLTLTKILKRQFGFTGFVMSDWGGTHSTAPAANAGLDMEMNVTPGTYFGAPLKAAVQAGQVRMSRLNDMVSRILRSMFRVGLFDHPTPSQPGAYAANVERPQDLTLARTISEQGTVLLKNQDSILPLSKHGLRIAVIGPGAGPQGAENFYGGAGSGHVPEFGDTTGVVSPLQGIEQRASSSGDTVLYADGTSQVDATTAAAAANVAVVFVGAQDSEGTDRSTMDLSSGNCTLTGCTPQPVDQDQLIAKVAAANPHTIVVLNTGGPVVMPWLKQIQGLFEAWYPGQQDGNAIAALLFGDVDPGAKLPETFPASQSEIPTHTPQQWPGVDNAQKIPQSDYSEGLLVGYRWYDAKRITPLFPFGFGLSYTSFAYHRLKLSAARGGGILARARISVANTGHRSGSDVPQMYIADPASTGEPPRQLKGFAHVQLAPGASTTASFPINARSLSYWSAAAGSWKVASGCYRVMIGHSERDITQQAVVAVNGARCRGAVLHLRVSGPSCGRPTGRLAAKRLGPVTLGEARGKVRRKVSGYRRRGQQDIDFYCLASRSGLRVGYPSHSLLRHLGRKERARVRGRAILILTSSRHYALRTIRAGEKLTWASRAVRLDRAMRIGRNQWFLVAHPGGRGILRVQHGRVQELGIVDRRLTGNRRAARRLLASFS
jgi:beta-glucosidase